MPTKKAGLPGTESKGAACCAPTAPLPPASGDAERPRHEGSALWHPARRVYFSLGAERFWHSSASAKADAYKCAKPAERASRLSKPSALADGDPAKEAASKGHRPASDLPEWARRHGPHPPAALRLPMPGEGENTRPVRSSRPHRSFTSPDRSASPNSGRRGDVGAGLEPLDGRPGEPEEIAQQPQAANADDHKRQGIEAERGEDKRPLPAGRLDGT